MKRLVTILSVMALLVGAAIFYGDVPDEPAEPVVEEPKPDEPELKVKTKGESPGTLKLTSSMSHGYLERGSQSAIYAAIDIEAIEFEGTRRPALNLAVVIDRSGSMSGDKMRYARRAAKQLVDSLSARDRLTVIAYANQAQVVTPSVAANASGKLRLKRSIDGISPAGGTNIAAGIDLGVTQLTAQSSEESVNRMILLSDGRPTVGETSIDGLGEKVTRGLSAGMSLTTMGVGLDYNEDLMAALAGRGAGNYYFVDQPSAAMAFFEEEFEGLATTVARNSSLVLELAPSVRLERLFGFDYTVSGPRVMVPLAEFYSAQQKNLLVRLSADMERVEEVDVLKVALSYDDVVQDSPAYQSLVLRGSVTTDAAMLEQEVDTDVIARVQQVEVGESMKEAMSAYQRGDAAEAKQVLERRRQDLAAARSKHDFGGGGVALDRVDQELEATMAKVQATPSKSAEGRRMIKRKKARGRMILMDKSAF